MNDAAAEACSSKAMVPMAAPFRSVCGGDISIPKGQIAGRGSATPVVVKILSIVGKILSVVGKILSIVGEIISIFVSRKSICRFRNR